MTCSRGAASPSAGTQRKLWASSAGYCQNPTCQSALFVDVGDQSIHFAEMAHVFAATDGGPRTKENLTHEERGAFENLLLLCANCHTLVDKAPETYTDEVVLRWKHEHAAKIERLFGVVRFASRAEARAALEPILGENRFIFDKYGPHIESARDPESGAWTQWKRKVLSRILPNNNRLLGILDVNRHLLLRDEESVLESFRQHVNDLEAVHIEGSREDASRFPMELINILRD